MALWVMSHNPYVMYNKFMWVDATLMLIDMGDNVASLFNSASGVARVRPHV